MITYQTIFILFFQVDDQKYKCYNCQIEIKRWKWNLKSNYTYCHYTNYWYCINCISEEKTFIPWYVIEDWNFSKYTVCKQANEELKILYNKYIILIDIKADIVKKNKTLYNTLVIIKLLYLILINHNRRLKDNCI